MNTLTHFVTGTIQGLWTLIATHPIVTIPGAILVIGALVVGGRTSRSN